MSKFIVLNKYRDGTDDPQNVFVAIDAIRSIESAYCDGEEESFDSLLTFTDGSVLRVWESPKAIIDEIKETCERTESKC